MCFFLCIAWELRGNFYAWMMFVPLWLTFSYNVGAFTIWGSGFLQHKIIDYAGGYVIHISSGVAGFLWIGWTGFNGGSPFNAGLITSLAIINTHICTPTSLLVWLALDMAVDKKSSVIGAVQGMITGLVCITPGAGMFHLTLHVCTSSQKGEYILIDIYDTCMGSSPNGDDVRINSMVYNDGLAQKISILLKRGRYIRGLPYTCGGSYGLGLLHSGLRQMRIDEEDLEFGDDAVHRQEAYALWGDGERMPKPHRLRILPICRRLVSTPI
ncbi:hypothetical protein REPUB_Repub10bG0182500 [Reevesia pubescens]